MKLLAVCGQISWSNIMGFFCSRNLWFQHPSQVLSSGLVARSYARCSRLLQSPPDDALLSSCPTPTAAESLTSLCCGPRSQQNLAKQFHASRVEERPLSISHPSSRLLQDLEPWRWGPRFQHKTPRTSAMGVYAPHLMNAYMSWTENENQPQLILVCSLQSI